MAGALDMSDVVFQLFGAIQSRLRTAVVVKIESYDAAEGSATVTPMVLEERIIEGERVEIPSATIPDCPVIFPFGGGRGLTFGLEPGDQALGLYRHRSHDEIDGGASGPILPQSTRRIDQSDLIVLPGFFPPSGGYPSSAIRSDGQPVMALPGGESVYVGSSTAAFALVRWDQLQLYIQDMVTLFNAHIHPVSGPNTGTPSLPAPNPGDLSSDAFKVDR